MTLDPNKFAEKKQQLLHIGNLDFFYPFISLHKERSPVKTSRLCYYSTNTTVSVTQYPPDTRAFLYYSMSPEKPRIAEELRLWIASSDDPASFKNGSDQMVSHGRVHFILFQNIFFLCMKNWGKNNLFQTTWTQFYLRCPYKDPNIAGLRFFIH